MITLSNVRLRAFNRGYLDLFWDYSATFESIGDYDIYVQRSEAEFGPYVDISPALVDKTHFRDITAKGYTSFFSRNYYRLRVVKRATSDTAYYPEMGGARLEARPDLAALEMARHTNLRLRESEGREVWIYQRKRAGQRCTTCFDRATQRSTRADCPVCFGTTWVGGYHSPIRTYAQVLAPQEMLQHTSNGPVETKNSLGKFGNYPELFEGDVVVEAENIRWKVGSPITKIQKSRALIRQQAPLAAIPVTDIEYALPLNLSLAEAAVLEASPERNYTNPKNLETASLNPALSTLFGGK